MSGFTDVFGTYAVPPSEASYSALALSANLTLQWPEFFTGTGSYVTSIMDVTPSVGSLTLSFPDATKVSVGRDVLIRNLGSFTFTVLDNAGGVLATVAAGTAHYLYLSSNTTVAGAWGHVAFGVGTSSVDAASLVGYGIKAIAASLNQSHPTFSSAGNLSIDSTYRAKLVIGTDTGATTVTLGAVATLGDDYFFMYHNSGAGTTTFTPSGTDKIDGQATFTAQPGESLMMVSSGAGWFTVGYGRSVVYNFTQLTYDVSAGGTFTLTAAEASNKLITFIGNPVAGVTVVVPQTVAVYYLYNSLSTANNVTFKTIAGAGIVINQSQRTIGICDGTFIVSAVTITASTQVSLVNGSVTNPALNFASATNTGLYLNGASGLGIAVGGAAALLFDNTGLMTTSKTLSFNSGSITTSAPSLTIAQTWNAVGSTFDASTITITDTASAAASRFVNYLVGASSMFSVTKVGTVTLAGDIIGAATQNVFNSVSTTVNAFGAASVALNIGNAAAAAAFAGGISIPTGKNVTGAGTAQVTGFATVSATTLTGTLSTAAQPNITSVGTLTGLTVSGNATFGNHLAQTTVIVDGQATAADGPYISIRRGGTEVGAISTVSRWAGGTSGDVAIGAGTGGGISFYVNNSATAFATMSGSTASFGSNSLTAGVASFATLGVTGITTLTADAASREALVLKGRASDNSGRINLKSNDLATTQAAIYWGPDQLSFLNNALSKGMSLTPSTGAINITMPPAFAAGDKYLVIDASGNIHVSALGPAS